MKHLRKFNESLTKKNLEDTVLDYLIDFIDNSVYKYTIMEWDGKVSFKFFSANHNAPIKWEDIKYKLIPLFEIIKEEYDILDEGPSNHQVDNKYYMFDEQDNTFAIRYYKDDESYWQMMSIDNAIKDTDRIPEIFNEICIIIKS